ncbi:hypothetical protein IscW_ISCW007509, partial [Ixodes scapularis]
DSISLSARSSKSSRCRSAKRGGELSEAVRLETNCSALVAVKSVVPQQLEGVSCRNRSRVPRLLAISRGASPESLGTHARCSSSA